MHRISTELYVQARYRPGLPAVLKEVSFTIPSGSTCGVVGRTGSGKSSLLLALYELIDVTAGTVRLDGVDVAKVRLHIPCLSHILPQCPNDSNRFVREPNAQRRHTSMMCCPAANRYGYSALLVSITRTACVTQHVTANYRAGGADIAAAADRGDTAGPPPLLRYSSLDTPASCCVNIGR